MDHCENENEIRRPDDDIDVVKGFWTVQNLDIELTRFLSALDPKVFTFERQEIGGMVMHTVSVYGEEIGRWKISPDALAESGARLEEQLTGNPALASFKNLCTGFALVLEHRWNQWLEKQVVSDKQAEPRADSGAVAEQVTPAEDEGGKKRGPMALIIIVEACIVFALGVLGNKVAELVEIKPTALIVGACALLIFSIVLTLLRAKPVASDLGDKRCNSVTMRSIPRTMISLFPVGMLLGMVVVGVLSLFFAPSAQDFLYDYMMIGLIGIILGALFSISIVVIVDRKRKAGRIGKVIVLKGTQQLPYSHSAQYQEVKVEVFYPKPFKYTPTLTIRFPKRRIWGRPVYGESTRPEYRIIDQRPDGFIFQVLSLAVYEPLIEWVASGQPKD